MPYPSILRRVFVVAFCIGICMAQFVHAEDLTALETLTLSQPNNNVALTCAPVSTTTAAQPLTLHRTFIDDFNGSSLSSRLWKPYYADDTKPLSNHTLAGNNEKEIYVDPTYKGKGFQALGINPFTVKNGILSIKAQRTPPALTNTLYGFPYTSGVITTFSSFRQQYGYFEIRAKLPRGNALWPAFWLVAPYQWPPEIDVFEAMDGPHPDKITLTTHWKDEGTGPHKMGVCYNVVPGSDTAFHTYGVLWTHERVVYYIDRQPVGELATPPGLDLPMYMIANLAIEKDVDQTTPASATYDIDWIAAYQL